MSQCRERERGARSHSHATTLNPFQQPKSFFWLVYQQQEQQEEQQDAENPFLDPPFSRIKTGLVM
jgi:hypothetical protein